MKRHLNLIALLAVLVISSNSFGVVADLHAPTWRNDLGTTLQGWDFMPGAFPAAPVNVNVYDVPADVVSVDPNGPALLDYFPGFNQQWVPEWGGAAGVLPLSGAIEINIPNFPTANPLKEICLQVIWAPQAMGNGIAVSELLNPSSVVELIEQYPVGPAQPGIDWMYSQYKITITPNPVLEIIRIDGGIMVDSVFADTICIPEPATMAVLGLGGLISLLRKKK